MATAEAAATAEIAAADARAAAAEAAKIQLSMRLAELDDRAEDGGDDDEERFAAGVLTRRVTAAEQEAEQLKERLHDAEETVRRLEFQVRIYA